MNIRNIFYRIMIAAIICFSISILLINFVDFQKIQPNSYLFNLNSVISIIVAIIITYLFSKLFSERNIRIERKKKIDELSNQITYLRNIAFHIRGMHEFWKINGTNCKGIIDRKYESLTYKQFRGYPGYDIYKENWQEINEDISSTIGQAYLALKGLEDGESTLSFFSHFRPKNYSLQQIEDYSDYCNSFWYFLEKSSEEKVNFKSVSSYEMGFISELFFLITKKKIDEKKYISELKSLFDLFISTIFEKHYFLNKLNSDHFPSIFKNLFLNMLIAIIILIISLILSMIDINNNIKIYITIFLYATFITNIIDLSILVYKTIKEELTIEEIFVL